MNRASPTLPILLLEMSDLALAIWQYAVVLLIGGLGIGGVNLVPVFAALVALALGLTAPSGCPGCGCPCYPDLPKETS